MTLGVLEPRTGSSWLRLLREDEKYVGSEPRRKLINRDDEVVDIGCHA